MSRFNHLDLKKLINCALKNPKVLMDTQKLKIKNFIQVHQFQRLYLIEKAI